MYKESTLTHFKLSISDLFFTENLDLNFHIGGAILIGMGLTFLYRKKLPKNQKETLRIFLILGSISILMTLKIFPFEHMPSILKMIQFPWRMMEFETFFFSVIAGFGFAYFMNHTNKKEIGVVIFVRGAYKHHLMKKNIYNQYQLLLLQEEYMQVVQHSNTYQKKPSKIENTSNKGHQM